MDYQALVGIAPWTFIAQICNLLIQAALFKKFLFEPVKKIVTQRQDMVNQVYASAAKAEQSAREKEEAYDQLLLSARTEASELIRNATATAQNKSSEILHQAQQEAAHMKEKAQADIVREKKKALNDAKDEIAGLAMDIAGKVVGRSLDSKDQAALVDQFIDQLGDGL